MKRLPENPKCVLLFVFYLSLGLVQVCEIEISHMGKKTTEIPHWCAEREPLKYMYSVLNQFGVRWAENGIKGVYSDQGRKTMLKCNCLILPSGFIQ